MVANAESGAHGTGAQAGRGRLTRPRVLAAAIDLADRQGLAALTMRRLAAELGVEPMALYRYASGKEALLDGMVEAFYGEVMDRLGPVRPGDWRSEVHRIAGVFCAVADVHPNVFPLVVSRPLAVPVSRRPAPMLRLNERMLGLITGAGYDDRTTLRLYRALVGWVLGYLLVEKRPVVDNPAEPDPLLRLGLHRLPAAEYPRLRATVPLQADHDAQAELTAGLDLLLDQLSPPKPVQKARKVANKAVRKVAERAAERAEKKADKKVGGEVGKKVERRGRSAK
ncbi:TetR/AcrR family transcriptional regulator [Kitasatospora acidiphila]|uniref:TetR/AcrR family transcriptional regulator n=1 Tax=Kitasatospora acidiphila TaxID=2567942 RepID=A0A540W060_9ACTN|nr:TetR/AcrR family transcriptional regulator [Kitasatospora acidiphila]TQF02377.1 TetR/AcrR family transcriptional regulator [Kitasatospora acidiphila]